MLLLQRKETAHTGSAINVISILVMQKAETEIKKKEDTVLAKLSTVNKRKQRHLQQRQLTQQR